jgi:Mrp family chromosome partitioning ATPase
MSVWPTHPNMSARPNDLALTDGDRVELPEPESPLHSAWLDEATSMRGVRPQAVALRDAGRLETALRANVGGLRAAHVVGVFGAAGSGRTSVLLGLAAALTAIGRRVALLDADLAAPSLRRRLGCESPALVVGGLVLPYAAAGLRLQ